MAETLREVMRQSPVTVPPDMNLVEASRTMKEFDIGDLIVMENGTVAGIVTDRDITIRATAEGKDPKSTTLAEIYSKNLVTIEPDATLDEAVELMRSKALRLTTRSLTTGNAAARHGSTVITSPSLNLRMCS